MNSTNTSYKWLRRTFLVTLLGCLSFAAAQASNMEDNINDALGIIQRFKGMAEDKTIPADVIRHARGLVIMSVIKVGFVFSGHGGEGIIIARKADGSWSPPSGLATGGAGFGFQAGGQNTELVMVLNTDEAVAAFERGTNVKLGGELSVAAGPVGRNLNGSVLPTAAVYSYSRTEGLFAGVSVDGAVLAPEKDANEDYYGARYSVRQILSGKVPVPASASKLIQALSTYRYDP
jgi:lipid-binding SYLF domain-containing protein